MEDKKYSVRDLEALRRAVEHKWMWGTYLSVASDGMRVGRASTTETRTKAVEELVRTHMLAGHTAEDLYASEQDAS